MTKSANELLEDRALRDAARGMLQDDIAFIRESISARSLPGRLADRLSGSARDIADEAATVADEHRLALGVGLMLGVAGLAAWLFRAPLLTGIANLAARAGIDTKSWEPDRRPARSESRLKSYFRRR